jgi:hypothetical protein
MLKKEIQEIQRAVKLLGMAEKKHGKIKICPTIKQNGQDLRTAYQETERHGLMLWYNDTNNSTHVVWEKESPKRKI